MNKKKKNMKIIGLIGGMSWESSLEYYRLINETVKEKMGGLHSAKCVMYSVDFEEIEKLQHKGDWKSAAEIMVDAAQRIERAGAEFALICTNTMHKMAAEVQAGIKIPLLHIGDVTAQAIRENRQNKIGLLGTKFTMEQDFYKGRLQSKFNIDVIIPDKKERQVIHDIIYKELCLGEIKEVSRNKFKKIIDGLISEGAEGIILGCTEIPLIVSRKDFNISIYETTKLHAKAAVEYALR